MLYSKNYKDLVDDHVTIHSDINRWQHTTPQHNRTQLYNSNTHNDPMAAGDGDLDFYPAYCFKESPTHFTWVKMAAVDVHRLKRRQGFGESAVIARQYPDRQ